MIDIGAKFDDGWQFDGVCKKCGENSSSCKCKETKNLSIEEHSPLKIFTEKRKNKQVTIAREIFLAPNEAKGLLKTLKRTLGTGGSYKDNHLELQGNIVENLKKELIKKGFKAQ